MHNYLKINTFLGDGVQPPPPETCPLRVLRVGVFKAHSYNVYKVIY